MLERTDRYRKGDEMKGQDLISAIQDQDLEDTEISTCDVIFRTEKVVNDDFVIYTSTVINVGSDFNERCKKRSASYKDCF